MTPVTAARERLAGSAGTRSRRPPAETVRRTPSRRGVFLARRTPRTEGTTGLHTAQVGHPFPTPANSIRTVRRRPLSPRRGQVASERPSRSRRSVPSPCGTFAGVAARAERERGPGARSSRRLSRRVVPSSLRYFSPRPSDPRYRSPFQSHCFFQPLSIPVCEFLP